MSTDTRTPLTPEEADHQAMIDHALKGKPLDPEVSRRVRERADRIREQLKARGVTINAVDLIRESREEI
jgi:hypothetical protein